MYLPILQNCFIGSIGAMILLCDNLDDRPNASEVTEGYGNNKFTIPSVAI